jgi:RNA polymerase sigma factor (sigma-70 family)
MTGKVNTASIDTASDGFGTTTWSLVLAAGKEDDGNALERLCRKHWRPIYVFIRQSGLPAPDAEDATQEFFIHLLERGWLKQADPKRGSFRAFLLALLRNFLSNRRRVSQAEKRGGGMTIVSFDASDAERELSLIAMNAKDPAEAFEATWADDLLKTALARLEAEQKDAGKAENFDSLRPFVTQAPAPWDYQRLSEQLGIQRGQIALLIHRLNRRFAELIRAEVADTLTDRSDLETELRFLLEASAR